MDDGIKRLDEIRERFEEIKKESNNLIKESLRIFVKEVEKMFTWDLLKELEWHVSHPFDDKVGIRSIFKGDVREKFFELLRKSDYYHSHQMVINGYDVDIGSQGLAIIRVHYTEYLELAKKLKIVNVPNTLEKKMLRATIETLQALEKL